MANTHTPAPRVVVHGFYGAGNFGDDIIMLSVVQSLRRFIPGLHITVLTRSNLPMPQSEPFDCVPRSDLRQTQDAIKKADLFLCGGGGIFQDYLGFNIDDHFGPRTRGLDYYAVPIEMAYLSNVPVMFYGVGAGPLFSDMAKKYLKTILGWADVITVRDDESAALLRSVNPATGPVVTADPAVNAQLPAASYPLGGGRLAGLSLRHWFVMEPQRASIVRYFARMADYLIERHGCRVVLFPFNRTKMDHLLLKDVQAAMTGGNHLLAGDSLTLEEALGILPQLDFLIGMRLHSLIIASVALVPSLAFCYDEKVSRFMRQTGCADCLITAADIAAMNWRSVIDTFVSRQPAIRERLKTAMPAIRQKEKTNAELALGLLRRGHA